jgi:hypothetical protein
MNTIPNKVWNSLTILFVLLSIIVSVSGGLGYPSVLIVGIIVSSIAFVCLVGAIRKDS